VPRGDRFIKHFLEISITAEGIIRIEEITEELKKYKGLSGIVTRIKSW
jgi:hypothetical protein